MTKTIIASILAVGFATSAFAGDAPDTNVTYQPVSQQARVVNGTEAFAFAPAAHGNAAFTNAERREFDRATEAANSH